MSTDIAAVGARLNATAPLLEKERPPGTMKAIRLHQFGGPEVLRYEDAPRPEAAPGELVVRVAAAGVNPIDWKVREGLFRQMISHELPLIPGWELSGTV